MTTITSVSHTFKVDDVKKESPKEKYSEAVQVSDAVSALLNDIPSEAVQVSDAVSALLNDIPSPWSREKKKPTIFEAFSRSGCPLLTPGGSPNGFMNTCLLAYNNHYGLTLTPDAVWTTIAQGIANHINNGENAERLRSNFVKHEGKKEIEIQRDGFVRGSLDNDWEGCFAEFSQEIAKHIPEVVHKLLLNDFSTTGRAERAASEVVLMDAMQAYFEYGISTCCGVPEVTMAGEAPDWTQIRERLDHIESKIDSELSWWIDALRPTCDHFVKAAEGNPDVDWWQNFVKYIHPGSGDAHITGHVLTLFPYTGAKEKEPNRVIGDPVGSGSAYYGLTSDEMPISLAKAPVTWKYHGQKIDLEFMAGIVGVGHHEENDSVVPKIGWAIVDKS